MAFLLPFLPAIAEAVGTGILSGGAGYLAQKGLKKAGFKNGGIIQGKKGSKQLIVGHGGEMILPVPVVNKVKAIMKRKGKKTTIPKVKRPTLPKKAKGKKKKK
jgi:hypothetical protein